MGTPQTTQEPRVAEPGQDHGHPARSGHSGDLTVTREVVPADLPRIGFIGMALLALAGILVLGGLFLLGHFPNVRRSALARDDASAMTQALPVVSVLKPRPQARSTDLTLPADVQALKQTSVYPRANGYLRRMLVDIGDRVEADQLLAELDTPEVNAQLNQAQAAVQQAEASLKKAQVDTTLAESTLQRYQEAARTGAVAQQDLDEKRTQVDQAKASLNVAQANLAAGRAQVEQLQAMQSFARITAPFAGVITARNYDVGALLSPSNLSATKPLFQMEQIDTLRVFVNVPQTYATVVQPGQDAELEVRNYSGKLFRGKVVRSSGSIDQATRTLRVEIHVPNAEGLLYAGMYGQAQLHLAQDAKVYLVPSSALIFNADGLSLGLVENGVVRFQRVSAGRDFGVEIEIIQGLSGEERVVTNPGEHMRAGSHVQVVAAGQATRPTSLPSGQ